MTTMQQRRVIALAVAALALGANAVWAAKHDEERRERSVAVDARFGHNREYPVRGSYFSALPRGAVMQRFGGVPYYFHGGAWYRGSGTRFVVVAPPIGLFVPFLPPFYTTVWFGGVPYYYANDAYYVWDSQQNGYVVTAPPAEASTAATQAPGTTQAYVYPKNGQSEEQTAKDRYECYTWARNQTGFDPAAPATTGNAEQAAKSDEYGRANAACLEGRGYTVR